MNTVRSADGTPIAYDRTGTGRPIVLVTGAMTTRTSESVPILADALSQRLSVVRYDRRGRGDSGDTQPYGVEREIEDIGAMIQVVGGQAVLYGHSSGGCLALQAAVSLGDAVSGLALYEAPYNDDPAFAEPWTRYLADLEAALAEDRRGDAVALFMSLAGMPATQIEEMRLAPFWPAMEAIAPTLAYDHAGVMGRDAAVPVALASQVRVPTLVMHGSASVPFMAQTARTLAEAIPGATLRTLAGQPHSAAAEALAPVLLEAFAFAWSVGRGRLGNHG
ncbi:MAG: alpha/beta fold hydrolase [Actinomycetota bacterium]